MGRLEISDDGFHAEVKLSVPCENARWWVRAMSKAADVLWGCHLTTASWAVADLCFWLQKKIKRVPHE